MKKLTLVLSITLSAFLTGLIIFMVFIGGFVSFADFIKKMPFLLGYSFYLFLFVAYPIELIFIGILLLKNWGKSNGNKYKIIFIISLLPLLALGVMFSMALFVGAN